MRPIASAQSLHRFPLNEVFGAESHVRILRVLAELEEPLSTTRIAERSELTAPGARRALASLVQTGLVERAAGAGKRQQYALRSDGPLISEILQLFDSERRRSMALLQELRQATQLLSPPPTMAWTRGFPARFGDPWEIVVVHTAASLAQSIRELRQHVADVEEGFGVTVEISGFTHSDQRNIDVDRSLLLAGVPPGHHGGESEPPVGVRSHQGCAGRSIAHSRALVKLIERDPPLVKRARLFVEQILAEDPGPANHDLEEWRDILQGYSLVRLSQFLTSSSVRAVRLHSSNPLFAILSTNEREHLLAAASVDA